MPRLVSVVVIAFNQDWCLSETLATVAAQTYRPLECVIVDDGSTDETASRIKEFVRQQDGRIAVVPIKQENRGTAEARNAGVVASHGEFIQFLDGDDLLTPTKLAQQVAFLEASKRANCDAVYGDAQWLHDTGSETRLGELLGIPPAEDMIAAMLTTDRFNASFSYLIRRAAVERTGRWRNLSINEDVDYFFRLACTSEEARHTIGYMPFVTGYYRKHQRPRVSDRGVLRRSIANMDIYTALEEQMRRAGLLTPSREKALASAYYAASCSASILDPALWKRSLQAAVRLDPRLTPRRASARLLHRALGTWRAESLLRRARAVKRRFDAIAAFPARLKHTA